MERLTIEYCGEYVPKELYSIDRLGGADDCDLCCDYCKATKEGNEDCRGCAINQCFNKLGEYEDLEEQGKLPKLPCKIGDTIYVIPSRANYGINIVNRHKENNRVYEQIVDHITFYKSGYMLSTCEGHACVIEESYKETWFLTKEEAETALRKLKDVWKKLEG